jgi:outer membrane protein assembly factor BamA/autotransporter translocation and assembly factor TamB
MLGKRLVIIAVAGASLLVLLAAHAPPARALVLRRVVEALHTSYGIDLRAESLSYNLLTLSAELRGIRVAAVRTPAEPFAAADAVALSFGARTLIGDVSVKRLSIASPRIDIRRRGDGTDNLPRVTSAPANSARVVLPPIHVDDLDVSFQQPSTSAAMHGAEVRLTSAEAGRISATVNARRGATVTLGDRTIDLDALAVMLDLARERLDLRELTASRPGGRLHASGSIALRGDASTVDATMKASSEIESWWIQTNDGAGPPVGRVEVSARVSGSLFEPTITFETNTGSLAWSDMQVSDVRARGDYRAGEFSLTSVTLDVAGGKVEAHGAIALHDARRTGRIEARWTNLDAGRIPVASLDGTLSKSGTAVVEWRADGTPASPRFDVTATTGVVASGMTTPIVVHASGRDDRWHVKAFSRDTSVVDATASADIDIDPRRWRASRIVGRVAVRTTDLPAAIRRAQSFGVPAGLDPATAAGTIDVDAAIDGTLGAVRSTGRITGRAVTIAGLPRLDLDASFGVDVAGETSSGTFRLLAPRLESATFVANTGVTLGGSLIATGTWSGPLGDPTVDATLAGRDLTFGRGGPVAIAAAAGAFDGVLKGPVTKLGAEGTLTIGSVNIGGRGAGAVTADLTLSAGTVRVEARAPSVKTTLDASIGLETPNPFSGRGTLADLDVDALLAIAGLGAGHQGSVRGRVWGSVGFRGDLRNRSSTTVTLDVAPIDATAFDVPIAMSRGLHASLTGGRVHLEDVAMTIGGLALRLGGTLATDRSGGTVMLDVDGDLGSLRPWWTRLSGSADVAGAGRITGHLETEASSAGLVATGSIETTLATLSKGERHLASDVRALLALTGDRAEVRVAIGSMRGGQLTAAGDAPLTWLNHWLPAGLQIAQPTIDRPAALEGTASFDVPALFDLLGRPPIEAVGGRIELSAKLSASRPDPADITGDLTLGRGEVSTKALTYTQSDVTRFRLAKGALSIERLDWRGPGSRVVGTGSVGLLEGIDTNLRLDVDTELGIVGALLSGRATGRLDGSIDVHGQPGALRVTSDATLRDASWLVPGQRILFAGWSGQIRLEDQALSVTKLGGTVNGGTVRIDGRLPLEAGIAGAALTIAARDILIDVPRGLHSQLGADLVWQQTERAAQLQGKVEITANRYTEPVTRILQLVNSLSSATRRGSESTLPSWLAGTMLDIGVAVTDPILIDNSVGTVELMPDLRLAGTIDSPALSGRVDVVDDGRITIGGRAYRLRDSQLRFAPADGLVPTVDAAGDTRIGDYDVSIRISGTPDRIETSFSSVPPLGERELQSLIVTGQTGEQSTRSRPSDDTFAAAAAATDILGFAGRFVGLDTVRIGAADLDLVSKDVSTEQHLTVSKSLGSSFELIFSDNLEDGSVTWVLVWKPTAVNEVRASSVEDGTRALEFRRTIVFGPGSPAGTTRARRTRAEQPRTVVDSVRITGAPGFSERELSDKLELDAGNRFDVRRWIEDRHRLEEFYLDGGYHRVRIVPTRSEAADHSRVSLTYDIQRGPKTVIEATGDPLPDEVIDAMYDAWRGLPIADVARTEFDRIAREGLARRGYYRPGLRLNFSAETPELARVTLHVARGPRTEQLTVAWSGNRDVSNADLDALIAPHRAESAVWLDSQAIAWQVRQLYASRGHLQAQVTVGEPAFDDTGATLPIAIDEGVLSRLAGVRLEGVDPARRMAATEALGLSIGEPLAASAPVEAARRLKAFYTGLGYRRAGVTHTLTTAEDGSVSIAWAVEEGPLYRVKDVNVVGAETTSAGLVQKAITLEPGDAMSQSALETTRRNLYDIGSFRRVDFDFGDSAIQSAAPSELPRTLTIQAEEPQRFQVKYGVQFSFDRSSGKGGGTSLGGSAELRDRNFIGRAVQASIGAHWDPDLQITGLLLSSPRMFGKRVRTNVYARDRREQDVLDSTSELEGATLDDRRRELTFEQRWRPASAWELVWGYGLSFRRFLIDRDAQHFDGGGLLAGPVVSVVLDRRDSPFDATRGLFHSSSFQFGVESLGSELGYVRYLLRQSYYQPLGKLTAAGSVRYGTIQHYSGVAPISIVDLFFNAGGTNSVRGYPEDSLSAINVAGFTLGGTDLLVLNGELRFPITKRLGGAAFVDAGNTFANVSDLTLGRLALGAGLGLRIRTPLAPFRLDVAYPFSDAYGQHGVRVHFSIGQMF